MGSSKKKENIRTNDMITWKQMGLHVLESSKANYKGNVKIKAVISNSA
jgi:hypothetical protein